MLYILGFCCNIIPLPPPQFNFAMNSTIPTLTGLKRWFCWAHDLGIGSFITACRWAFSYSVNRGHLRYSTGRRAGLAGPRWLHSCFLSLDRDYWKPGVSRDCWRECPHVRFTVAGLLKEHLKTMNTNRSSEPGVSSMVNTLPRFESQADTNLPRVKERKRRS